MNPTVRSLLPLLIVAAIGLGCVQMEQPRIVGSGVVKSEARQVEAFDKVTIDGSADVTITAGGPFQVSVETDDNVLPVIETKVRGDTLVISSSQSYSTKRKVQVTISVPELNGISIRGSGDVGIKGIKSEAFSASIAGSGDVTAAGAAQHLDASIRGSGDLNLADLQAQSATVSIAGSGDVTVNASDELSVSIAGSGDVRYKGAPQKLNKSIAGSGSVRQAG